MVVSMFFSSFFKKKLFLVLFVLQTFVASLEVSADCFSMSWTRHDRPWDYYANETRMPDGNTPDGLINLLEKNHLNQSVRTLQRGQTSPLPGDMLFIMRIIPNHPLVLDTYSRFEKKYNESAMFRNDNYVRKPVYAAECLFRRANKVFPGNAQTMLVWGLHHYRNDEYVEALDKLTTANALSPSDVEVQYNLGLTYAQLGNVDKAKEFAQLAYAAGYPLPGLKNKIEQLSGEKFSSQ